VAALTDDANERKRTYIAPTMKARELLAISLKLQLWRTDKEAANTPEEQGKRPEKHARSEDERQHTPVKLAGQQQSFPHVRFPYSVTREGGRLDQRYCGGRIRPSLADS
jgi:hypothetical protein